MDTRGNENLREMLAAEYALGTLRGGARRRFERWVRHDDSLRALAFAWSERLAPLIDGVAPETPPKRVWEAIEARLPGFTARQEARAAAIGWWDRLGFWRGLSAAFATLAVVAFALASRPTPVVERTIVRVEPQPVPSEPKIVRAPPKIIEAPPRIVEVDALPSAVAMLVDKKGGQPVAVVMESKSGDTLTIQVAADVAVAEGKTLQLWMAPNDAAGLVSLGVLPTPVDGQPIRVTSADAATLARVKAFGLSLEPSGGSPQPTQVLGLGALVRVKS